MSFQSRRDEDVEPAGELAELREKEDQLEEERGRQKSRLT